ncbi:MAG: DUF4403 family protein [Alphaproteobacteria bacterium]|nr:DUF4403 family protein [Alphaproteobacteria bacterium]
MDFTRTPLTAGLKHTMRCPRLVIVASFWVLLCAFEAPAPQRTPPPVPPKPPLSFVSATLRLPADAVIAMLNERTRSRLAIIEGEEVNCLIQKCRLDLTATRTGEITGEAIGSGLRIKLPFALHAHLGLDANYLKTDGEATAQGVMDADTQLKLQPDWRLESHTAGQVHLSNAKLKLGPLKMSVTQLWNSNGDRLSGPIFRLIDKRMMSALKLRGQVERLWRKLQQPIRIGKNPDTWLVLAPENVRVTPLQAQGGALIISLGAAVRAHAIIGSLPVSPPNGAKLPAPATLESASNTFEASVPVTLSYGDAARLAIQRLRKKPLRAAGVELDFKKITILPSRDDLVVQARFCAGRNWDFTHLLDSCGTVYLRGVPRFDGRTGKLEIDNLRYDIGSENLMLRLMRALAGDALSRALQPHLVFDESRVIAKLKRDISAALATPQGRGVALTGKIASFGEPRLTWTKDGFLALLTAKGTVSAALNLKPPS